MGAAGIDRQRQLYAEQIQPSLDEPVLAVGAFALPGTRGNLVIRKLTRYMPGWRPRVVRRNSGLPASFIVVITASAVHAFSYDRAGNGDVIAGDHLRSWSRERMRTTVIRGERFDHVTLLPWDEPSVVFESDRDHAPFNEPAIAALTAQAAG